MSFDLTSLIDSYNAATVREMAEAADVATKQNNGNIPKYELVKKMAREYFTEARVKTSYAKLSQDEKAIINRLLLRDGTASARSFERELIRAGLATKAPEVKETQSSYYYSYSSRQGYEGNPLRKDSTIFEDVMARLTYHGLVFSAGAPQTTGGTPAKLRYSPGQTLLVPKEIRAFLPQPQPVPVSASDWQPARTQPGDPMLFLRDLYLYWDFARRNEVLLLQSGLVGKRSLNPLNEVLIVSDTTLRDASREDQTDRLYLLRRLLVELKLLEARQGKLQTTARETTAISSFWQWEAVKQFSACLETWTKLSESEGLGQGANRYNARTLYAKEVIIQVMKTLPADAWIELDDFAEQVREVDLDFLFTDHTAIETHRGGWYYGYGGSYYGDRQGTLDKMEQLEDKFVRNCITGFLHALGMVDLGYDAKEMAARAFRLTNTGGLLLGMGNPPPAAADEGRIIIQPNFQIMALGPVPIPQLAYLDLFAERRQADRGAFEYHLSRDSIYQAQQTGLTVDQIVTFLTETGHADIPQNVRRSLEEWAAHLERIVFRTDVSLLQAADEDLLQTLLEQSATGKHLRRQLTPTTALVKNKQQPRLVEALVNTDLPPAVSGANPAAADNSLLIDETGFMRPIHAVPSLHLRGRVERLAEEANGGWQLTEKSVSRAGGSRSKVNALVEELQKLHRGALPATLIAHLRSWGGYYGSAAAETLTLIEFQDQAALAELAAHPDLSPYLTPFQTGDRALAIIPTDQQAEVEAILARFGVAVKAGLKR
jgi:hypothetical protein